MTVLTPIAFIWSKKLWVTGAEESTASTRGSVTQRSVARALGVKAAKPASNMQTDRAGRAAERLLAGIGIPCF